MKNLSKGQSLIEVLVSLSAVVVIITSITYAVISALQNAEFSKNQNFATQISQQGLELARSLRDSNYKLFTSFSGIYCLDSSYTSIDSSLPQIGPNGCGQNVGIYVRQLDFERNSPSCDNIAVKVTSTVFWTDAKCTSRTNIFCHNVSISTCLSDYLVLPTP